MPDNHRCEQNFTDEAESDKPMFDAFDYHEPTDEQRKSLDTLRTLAKDMRYAIGYLPKNRESALALTNLEQALMWANKAVFDNGKTP